MPARLVPATHGGARQDQPVLRPGHADIQQPPRLLDLRLRRLLTRWRPAWKLSILHAHHVDPRKLEPLCRMKRQQVHPPATAAHAVAARRERDTLQEGLNLRLERTRLDVL